MIVDKQGNLVIRILPAIGLQLGNPAAASSLGAGIKLNMELSSSDESLCINIFEILLLESPAAFERYISPKTNREACETCGSGAFWYFILEVRSFRRNLTHRTNPRFIFKLQSEKIRFKTNHLYIRSFPTPNIR